MVTYENKIIRRSWKERLLSWPWKLWKAEKTILETKPLQKLFVFGGLVVGHPEIMRELKKALEEGKDASTFGLPTTKF
jgi:hypothetical protein